jgi:hypothetical protein
MSSRHSASLILVWRVAEFEACQLNSATIEPTHLLIGLCKVVDLDLPELVSKNTPDRDEVLEELLREVRRLRTVFRVAGVDAKILRRSLRRACQERRFSLDQSKRLRRSPAAKAAFADAEHFAQLANCSVYPIHLLCATLLAEDEHRDASLARLNLRKKRLLNVAKRDALTVKAGFASDSQIDRTRWN